MIKAKNTITLVSVYDGAKGDKGDKGDRGPTGAAGANGKGISGTAVAYQAGTSGTTVPTGSWTSGVPNVSAGQYLWTRTTYTYTDGETFVAYSVGRMGANGANGAPGKGISGTSVTYQASASGTTAPTGTWTSGVPGVAQGQYLWTRTITSYTDGATTTAYSVGRMGANGANGADGKNGIIVSAAAPSNPVAGQLWQNSSTGIIKKYNGSTWDIWYLQATNIRAENLSAISAKIGPMDITEGGFKASGNSQNQNEPYNAYVELDGEEQTISIGYTLLGQGGGEAYSRVACNEGYVTITANHGVTIVAPSINLSAANVTRDLSVSGDSNISGDLKIRNNLVPIIKTYSGTMYWGQWIKIANYESGYAYNRCQILSITHNRYAADNGLYKTLGGAADISAGLKADGIYIATSDGDYSGKTAYVTVAYF